jgi:hypothetical protein
MDFIKRSLLLVSSLGLGCSNNLIFFEAIFSVNENTEIGVGCMLRIINYLTMQSERYFSNFFL